MAANDPLDQVLRLVAEGRLSAEEAAPILAALDEQPGSRRATSSQAPGADPRPTDEPSGFESPPGSPTSLRLEVREAGRPVVNLRLPLAVGRMALDRVPGLSADQVQRVKEALSTGMRGPILLVEDGDTIVRMVVE
jgi:hypothetical protein